MLFLTAPSAMESNLLWASGVLAVALALIHIWAKKLLFLQIIPRSRWLSFGSGVSVAYIFVHVLPELGERQEAVHNTLEARLSMLDHPVYIVALLGMATFYGLERLAKQSRQQNIADGDGDVTEAYVFWIHMASFAIYNALIGYLLLHRETSGLSDLVLYAIAMALHFLVNDYGLRQDHRKSYDYVGRWILSSAIMVGWTVGAGTQIHPAAIGILFAFLAGGVILNVLKEELPEERESRFGIFFLGVIFYTALLMAL